MNPALSLLLFTTLSGAGLGLLLILGAVQAIGGMQGSPAELWLGLLLLAAGLAASAAHLGQPQRALRSFSQWRSSWLSREAVAAAGVSAVAVALLGLPLIGTLPPLLVKLLSGLLALLSVLTLVCTASIYASLKPIPAWHNRWVVPGMFLLGLYSGAWLFAAAAALRGQSFPAWILVPLAIACVVGKLGQWQRVDRTPLPATLASAVGVPGRLRSFERPHQEVNFLLSEMGNSPDPLRCRRRRRYALLLLVLPLLLFLLPAEQWAPAIPFGAILVLLGMGVERWLFFAEARHTVGLYYGLREGSV